MDIVERLRKNCFCSEVGSTPCRFEEECENSFDGADEIERLRLANSDLQMHYDHARTECDKFRSEVLRLSGSLAFISMLTPLSGQSWEIHAKFITAYALDQLKEKE